MEYCRSRKVGLEAGDDGVSVRLTFRPDWPSALGAAFGLVIAFSLLMCGEGWFRVRSDFFAVAFPVIILGVAFGFHRFLVVRASYFDFAAREFRVRTNWAIFLKAAETRIPLKILPPVETGIVNQNDMAPSWGIFVRPPGAKRRIALCGGLSYGEAAELATMLNFRRSLAINHPPTDNEGGSSQDNARNSF